MNKETRFANWLLENMDEYSPVEMAGKLGWLRHSDQSFLTSRELVDIYKEETE